MSGTAPASADLIVSALVVLGGAFALIGSWGLVRLPSLEREAVRASSAACSNACAAVTCGVVSRSPSRTTPGQRSVIHILDQKVFNLNPDYFSYTVSKLALERSVALQAQALAPALRVCGVAPGLMFLSGPQTQENFDRNSRVNLLREPIDPAQVAATCLFLAQNPCITGTTVCVDNGQHLVPLARDVMFLGEPKDPA